MKRKRKPLTRAAVITAALELLDEEGLPALSMRRLAPRLRVEAMSLYNHVKDKQDLLQSVVDAVLGGIPPPDPRARWDERLKHVALELYRALVAHPHLAPVIAAYEERSLSAAAMKGLDTIAAALAESGLEPTRQVNAMRSLFAMSFGAVLTHTRAHTMTRAQAEADWRRRAPAPDPGGDLPHLARLAPHLLATRPEDDFQFLLDAWLAAVRRPTRPR
jgi:TetR/AcrR family tetracycline transcriptional repressor